MDPDLVQRYVEPNLCPDCLSCTYFARVRQFAKNIFCINTSQHRALRPFYGQCKQCGPRLDSA